MKLNFLTALVITFVITACQPETRTSPEALKLGSLLPVTGDAGAIGKNLPKAVTLAVETINACGGVNNQPVQLVQEDSQTNPDAGITAMSKLVAVEEVAGVVGAWSSSVSSATVEIAVRNEVMQISSGSTSPTFTEKARAGEYNGYWARTVPSDTYQAQALAQLADQRGFDRVSTIVIDNSYGRGFEREFITAFEALGGTIANQNNPVRYDPNPSSLDSEITALFVEQPEAVLGIFYQETGALFLRSAYEQGFSQGVTLLLTDGVYSQEFVNSVGKTEQNESILKGALGTVPGASGPGLEGLTQKWEEAIGEPMTAFVAHTWDAAILMMLAAEKADENTGSAIKDHLQDVASTPGQIVSDPCQAIQLIRNGEKINYQGASGNLQFDRFGDTISSYDVWQVEAQGEINLIDQVTP